MNVLDLLAAISKGFFKFDDLSVFHTELVFHTVPVFVYNNTEKRKGGMEKGKVKFY